jgi:hypothetical protein
MQSRSLKIVMMLLLLAQSVASVALPCTMSMPEAPVAQDSLALAQQDTQGSCHERSTPSEIESAKCKSCSDGALCATACSITSSAVCSDSVWANIEHAHRQYQEIVQSISAPSLTELYRPPKLS